MSGRRLGRGGVVLAASRAARPVPAAGAAAAEYPINNCFADSTTFSTQAFQDFATRGMMWKRACSPEGSGRRGLVTGNVIRSGRVRRGARSYFILRAPAGTRFGRFTWSGQARRRDCRYALQVWASRPDGPPVPIKNVRANQRCPRRGNAQAAGWAKRRTYDVNGSNKIVQRIICVGKRGAPILLEPRRELHPDLRGARHGGRREPTGHPDPPEQPVHAGAVGERESDGEYDAADNVGVRLAQAVVGGLVQAGHARPCDFTRMRPVPERSRRDPKSTPASSRRDLKPLALQALDSAGNAGPQAPSPFASTTLRPGRCRSLSKDHRVGATRTASP